MKLQLPFNLSNSSTLQDLTRFTAISLTKLQAIINGNVDLIDNGNNEILSFIFTKSGVDVGVSHNLGTVPRGYINVGSNVAMTLTNGNAQNTSSTLYLQSNSVGTVKVMVF